MAALTLKRWNLSIGDGHPLVVIAGLNVFGMSAWPSTWAAS